MTTWSGEIKELSKLYESFQGHLPDIVKELEQLIRTQDANVVMLYSRRCLEVIVTDLCECELKRPRKTEPLKGIIDKLNSEEKVPSHIIASMLSLNSMSTYGTHPKDFDPQQVKPVLNNLAIIIRWYLKYKNFEIVSKTKNEGGKYESQDQNPPWENISEPKKKLILMYPAKKLNSKVFIAAFLVLVLIVLGFLIIPKLSVSSEPDEKSIAVLPFENMGSDNENSWFGNSISSEVKNLLNNISGLIVRPIDSFNQNNRSGKSIATIGKELKANYLINGSTSKFGDQIRISVNLSNTLTNTQIWSEQFECDTKDFQITQSEIVKQLAYKLKKVLSPEEVSRIDKKMTDEPEAYKLYARGNEYMGRNFKVEERIIAIQFYEQAIKIDPEFSMAYLQLAMCHLVFYWYGYDSSVESLKKCKEAMDAAFKADPEVLNTPEAHISLANYYYMGFLNYSKALEEISIAEKLSKNSFEYYDLKANIYRRKGDWDLAKENYKNAVEDSPNSPIAAHNVAVTFFLTGEYQKSETYFKSASLLNPTYPEPYWQRILMHMKWDGNTIKSREILAEAFQFNENLNDAKLFESSVLMDIYDSKYESAIAYLSSKDIDVISTPMYINLTSLLYARIYNLMNLPEKAQAYFDSARISIESRILKTQDDPKLYSALGIAYAGLGQKGKAIEAGAKAVSLTQISKDAYFGVYRIEDLARIFVMVGDYDKAIDQVKLLLSIPGPISKKMLLLDQSWKPLWDMPEFKKILRKAPADNSRN